MGADLRIVPSGKPFLRLIIVVLIVIIAVLLAAVFWLRRPPPPNYNALALGKDATRDLAEIVLVAPAELDKRSRSDVLKLRRQYIEKYKYLLMSSYEPDGGVFGQIEDGLPWWGMEGQFYWGSGRRSIEGPAEEARFLLNPYLLVAADFQGLFLNGTPGWNQSIVTEADLDGSDFPFTCMPRALKWFPRRARGEATYNVSQCMERMSRWATQPLTLKHMTFDLIAYNARDLNMNYMVVSFKDSANIEQWQQSEAVFPISHFIHRGGSCGYPGDCNNMSPATPEISAYWVTALPARMHIKLWRNEPKSRDQTADMVFTILFE
jgi:hypothetical protein